MPNALIKFSQQMSNPSPFRNTSSYGTVLSLSAWSNHHLLFFTAPGCKVIANINIITCNTQSFIRISNLICICVSRQNILRMKTVWWSIRPSSMVPFRYLRILLTVSMWIVVRAYIDCETWFTSYTISDLVKIKYWNIPTILL